MTADALRPFRDAIDGASLDERAAFARTARNAVARAILAASLAADETTTAPEREPPEADVESLLGPDLGAELAALYRGGQGWPSRAIDLLAPLNELAHTG